MDDPDKPSESFVIFELPGIELEAHSGERLLDLLDDAGHFGLPVACRAANCGACRVKVLDGERALVPPGAAEQTLLDQCNAQRSERLGCQICVTDAPPSIRVRLQPAGSRGD